MQESNVSQNLAQSSSEETLEVAEEAIVELSKSTKPDGSVAIPSNEPPSRIENKVYSSSIEINETVHITPEEKLKIEAAQSRRKSTSWKGFNFKRQLSKVDVKLKNTFSASQDTKEAFSKKSSVFYLPSSSDTPSNEESKDAPAKDTSHNIAKIDSDTSIENSISTQENAEKAEEENLSQSPDSSHADICDRVQQEQTDGSSQQQVSSFDNPEDNPQKPPVDDNDDIKAMRPDNLPLFDDCGKPIRPPRQYKKTKSMYVNEKRDQRLLSVPNIKYSKQENVLRDLRKKKDASTQPQSTFTGNLMRRFSKYLK